MVPLEAPYPGVYIDTFIFFLRSFCKIIWMNVHYPDRTWQWGVMARTRTWVCVHCDLHLWDMTLCQSHATLFGYMYGQQLCEILFRFNLAMRSYGKHTDLWYVCTMTLTLSDSESESEIGCLTSHATILKLYMWRHIDVQADWRRSWTYGRAPNAIDISWGSLTCPSKHRHGTTIFIR